DTRRREFDEWLYERANRPTLEDDREGVQRQELRRSLNDPPGSEVYSGAALNTLLVAVQKRHGQGACGSEISLDEEMLRQINFTAGNGGGNAGLLKNEGRLDWPFALRKRLDQAQRGRVEELLREAVTQAKKEQHAVDELRELDPIIRRFHQELRDAAKDTPP